MNIPIHSLRGVLAMSALAVTVLTARSHPIELTQYHYIYSGSPYNSAVAAGIMTFDPTQFSNPGNNDSTFTNADRAMLDVYMNVTGAANGNGTFTTGDFDNYYLDIDSPALNLNSQWVGQTNGLGKWGMGWGDLNFFDSNTNAPRGEDPFYLQTVDGTGDGMTLTSVTPVAPTTIYKQGDAVPGISNAVFTTFGAPAINDSGEIAFIAQWRATAGQTGSGIFTNGVPLLKTGDVIHSPTGPVSILSLGNPVINSRGELAFLITFNRVSPAPVVANSPENTTIYSGVAASAHFGGGVIVVAESATQPTDAPTGALWQSFNSVALPPVLGQAPLLTALAKPNTISFSTAGAMFTGVVRLPGTGNLSEGRRIATTTANGLWAADANGNLHMLLLEGVTVIGSDTVKTFSVIGTVAGTPGQTHSFNNNGEVVANVTFMTGKSAIIQLTLPYEPILY